MNTNILFSSYLSHFFIEQNFFQTKVIEKIKTHILCVVTFFRKSFRVWDNVKNTVKPSGHWWQYGSCAFHAGYLKLQIHTQNVYYLLLFHCNTGCTNAPQCSVTHTLSLFLCCLFWSVDIPFGPTSQNKSLWDHSARCRRPIHRTGKRLWTRVGTGNAKYGDALNCSQYRSSIDVGK